MNSKLGYILLATILLPLLLTLPVGAVVRAPQASTFESFESYADNAAFLDAWRVTEGAPGASLSTSAARAGTQSMRLDYAVNSGYPSSAVSHDFGRTRDLSSFTTLTLWHQGAATNDKNGLYVALMAGSNAVLEVGSAVFADEPGWKRWDIDLSTAGADLDAITAVVVGLESDLSGSSGSGTVYIDEIGFNNGLETVWLGGTTDWTDATGWSAGAPTSTTNARIPTIPSAGPDFPAISATGAAVHDLVIEEGATLDLGAYDLAVSGTMTSKGTILQRQAVGAGMTVPFLTAGGHPGLVIQTAEPFLLSSTDAPAFLNDALGETVVSIKARHSCATSDDSVRRCFVVTPSSSGTAVTMTFYFAHEELNEQACEAILAYNWHGAEWHEAGTILERQCVTEPYGVTVSGVTDFSPFVLAVSAPLAIGLQTFAVTGVSTLLPVLTAAAIFILLCLAALSNPRLPEHLWNLVRRLTNL
jgi:hypothetical protein